MVTNRHGDSVDITLRSYETAAQRYADQSSAPSLALCAFLDLLADSVAESLLGIGLRDDSSAVHVVDSTAARGSLWSLVVVPSS